MVNELLYNYVKLKEYTVNGLKGVTNIYFR